jgi:hypothetical protein
MDSVVDNEITELIASMIKDDNLPFNRSILNGTVKRKINKYIKLCV